MSKKISELAAGNPSASDAVPFAVPGVSTNRARKDAFQGYVSVTQYTDIVGDGVTDCTTGITTAVAAAAAGGYTLIWPSGNYLTTASIPLLHTVRHRGPGAILRGASAFYLEPSDSQTNTIYISGTGTTANDGLTASQPISDPQVAWTALKNYGPMLSGIWKLQQSAGTITNKPVSISGLSSRQRIQWLGPAVSYGVPTAILDGTGASIGNDGASFQSGMFVWIKDLKFQNWTNTSQSGLVALNRCDMWADNVHVNNCTFVGISCTAGVLYVSGGIINACAYGVQAYSQTAFNFGYSSRPTTVTACTTAGFNVRDSSSGDIIGCVATGNLNGVRLLHQSRARINGCTVTGNTNFGVWSQILCTVQDESGNTVTGNSNGNWVNYWSVDLAGAGEYIYDQTNLRHGWGGVSPGVKFHFRKDNTGSALTSATQFIFEGVGAQLGLAGDGTGNYGLNVGKPGTAALANWWYLPSDNSWRMYVNSVDAFRWGSNYYYPITDNNASLGLVANRWKESYVVIRRYTATVFDSAGAGTPLSVVVADIGSTYRRTDGGAGTSFYVKEANNGASTGWVAK
jgi:parallel beta-helix repeat protein